MTNKELNTALGIFRKLAVEIENEYKERVMEFEASCKDEFNWSEMNEYGRNRESLKAAEQISRAIMFDLHLTRKP